VVDRVSRRVSIRPRVARCRIETPQPQVDVGTALRPVSRNGSSSYARTPRPGSRCLTP